FRSLRRGMASQSSLLSQRSDIRRISTTKIHARRGSIIHLCMNTRPSFFRVARDPGAFVPACKPDRPRTRRLPEQPSRESHGRSLDKRPKGRYKYICNGCIANGCILKGRIMGRESSPNELPSPPPLTAPVFHILLALADEERHGYAIMQDVALQ